MVSKALEKRQTIQASSWEFSSVAVLENSTTIVHRVLLEGERLEILKARDLEFDEESWGAKAY